MGSSAREHKPHQTSSNFCIFPHTEELFLARVLGCWQIYRSLETARKYASTPIYKVGLTWELVDGVE